MIELIAPDARYRDSWLEAAMEFDGAHRDGAGAEDWTLNNCGIRESSKASWNG